MAGKKNQKKATAEFEVFCYEDDEGAICLEFGEAAISFSKKRFLEFADKLNGVRQSVLQEYVRQQSKSQMLVSSSYRI